MLQRVVMGQARFNAPGLAADSRGVVVGRQAVLRFSALDRLVAFLRLWSSAQAIDDLQPGLRLIQVRTSSGTREALILLSVTSVALGDAVVRAARTVGGQCFTGAGKHFVPYRDSRAPLGYDVTELVAPTADVDFVLYDQDLALSYAISGDLPLDRLLLRLDLQRQHGAAPIARDTLYLMVRRGLGSMVIEYLHRVSRSSPSLRVSAALAEAPADGAFQRGSSFWILRLEDVPARLLGLLGRTPGLTLLAPVADNVAIAVGYRHPVHLGSCKQVFPAERLFLFAPPPAGVTVIDPAPVFSPIADLVRLQAATRSPLAGAPAGPRSRADAAAPAFAQPRPPEGLDLVVPMRLEAAPSRPGRAVATIVPWERLGWLRSLCYALPPSVLRGHRLAVLERGLLVFAPDVLAGFPFGQLLHAPAPGLLIPVGWELRPAVSPDELAARVKATGGAMVVFPGPDASPFRIPAEAIESLEARALADPRLQDVRAATAVRPVPVEEPIPIEIANQPLGPMPLWRLGRRT